MVEQILGKRQAEDIFFSSMLTGLLNEKQASEIMEKSAKSLDVIKYLTGLVGSGLGMVKDTVKATPPALGWTALLGASAGGLGAMGYDAIKERVSQDDPEAKFNTDIEALYSGKRRELEDARWMARVRAKRDKLKREGKKMDPDAYEKAYNSLVAELDSKKELA
jgi:hypothetical protein